MDPIRVRIEAATNLLHLRNNPYPGRGIIMGFDEGGKVVQIYWIMGRSENSRNRLFVQVRPGWISTKPVDESKFTDPQLIIYDAMIEITNRNHGGKTFVVSNGHQTETIARSYMAGNFDYFDGELSSWNFEPDSPNFTPRITGVYETKTQSFKLSVIRKSGWTGAREGQTFQYHYSPEGKGFGVCATTYMSDGNPLPSFDRLPFVLPLFGNIDTLAETYWDTLDTENRVSLVVKVINPISGESVTKIVNRFHKA